MTSEVCEKLILTSSDCSILPLSQGPISIHVCDPGTFFLDVHFKSSSKCLIMNSVIELSTTVLTEVDYPPGLHVHMFFFYII